MTYDGNLISGLGKLVNEKLKGVQLKLGGPARAYRAASLNGSLVLCDAHLDARRTKSGPWVLTGEDFPASACDDCEDEIERRRR